MSQTSHSLSAPAARRFKLRRPIATALDIFASRLRTWRLRAGQRRELRELDDATLRDVGLSRSQARFCADQTLWRE